MKYMPNVDTMAAMRAPTGGVKNVLIICAVVSFFSLAGIALNAIPVNAKEHTIRYTARKA